MADTAFQTQYRQEFIAAFEAHQSLVRDTVTTEAMIKGNTATFLVAGSGSTTTAVTRGVNGLIPARADSLTQNSATLQEWHDLVRKTGFNIFASQGNQREIMQKTTMAVINRKIDSDIITQLNTATQDTGAAATATLQMAIRAKVILGVAAVPADGQLFGLVTPAFMGYLQSVPEFASSDYVNVKPLDGTPQSFSDKVGYYRWLGVNWIEHPNLPGVGTSAEKCFLYHRSAIGQAIDKAGIQSPVGYDEEQDYSYARCTVYMGSVLLQNTGVVIMNHDGSAFAAE
jgi:capsid protein